MGLLSTLSLLITPVTATDLLAQTGPTLSDIFGSLIIILYYELPMGISDIPKLVIFLQICWSSAGLHTELVCNFHIELVMNLEGSDTNG